jgi:hypothetical protein
LMMADLRVRPVLTDGAIIRVSGFDEPATDIDVDIALFD